MTQTSESQTSPDIDWRMSASLECVLRKGNEIAEVTSLAGAIVAWRRLDPAHRAEAVLTPERPVHIDGVAHGSFSGGAISALAARLPTHGEQLGL